MNELARILRKQTLVLRQQDDVQAGCALGASSRRLIVRRLLPNSLAPITVTATWNIANAVSAESYISSLGCGIPPPAASCTPPHEVVDSPGQFSWSEDTLAAPNRWSFASGKEQFVAGYFTTRVTVFKPGQAEQGQAALAALARIAAGIPGASVRVFRDRNRPERYVTFGQWPDPAAFQAFANHPDMAGVVPAIVAAFEEAYPADDQIEMDEVTP